MWEQVLAVLGDNLEGLIQRRERDRKRGREVQWDRRKVVIDEVN